MILPGPMFLPGVGMSLAFCNRVLNGVAFDAAPPVTGRQEEKCWLITVQSNEMYILEDISSSVFRLKRPLHKGSDGFSLNYHPRHVFNSLIYPLRKNKILKSI